MTSRGQERVVLVTGASSGIGAACARAFADDGALVFGLSRRGGDASWGTHFQADVTSEAQVRDAVEAVLTATSRIDVVVSNAGQALAGPVEETDVGEAWALFDINLFGCLRVCRAVLPTMRRQGSGVILAMSSLAGLMGIPFQGLYAASKFALEGMMESLRYEVAPFGVRVVLMEPGDVRTPITENRLHTSRGGTSPYGDHFARAIRTAERDERSGIDPRKVAREVVKISADSRPALRRQAAHPSQRLAASLKRYAPFALVESAISSHYGVTHHSEVRAP